MYDIFALPLRTSPFRVGFGIVALTVPHAGRRYPPALPLERPMDLTAARRTEEVPALLSAAAVDATRPLLTYCDDATGERTELSVAALGEWVARTANLLVDGCRLHPGDRAAVLLPPHWQTAAVLLGAWSAGVSVAFHPVATAGLPRIGPGAELPIDVTFVAHNRVDNWLEDVPEANHRFVLGLAPGAAPMREVPAGYWDYLTEVRDHGASLPPYASVRPTDAATVDGTSYRGVGERWPRRSPSPATSGPATGCSSTRPSTNTR